MGIAVKEAPILPILPERDHLEGCPGTRVERYVAVRPGKAVVLENGQAVRSSSTSVIVTRCVECGGEKVTDSEGNRV